VQQTNDGATLLFVRHTEVHNPDDILYGRLPRFRLTDLGRRQAEASAAALAEEPVTAIYSSPRLRARQTAQILAMPHPEARLHQSHLLDEVLTGWQGRTHLDLEVHDFNFYGNPLGPDDESLEDIEARLRKFVRRVRKRHPGETVVAVTHGDIVMVARAIYLRMPLALDSLRRPNVYAGHGSITRLTFPASLQETYPLSVDYYDPNATGQPWSRGWLKLQDHKGLTWS
jgi:broad specificity phosphatase PhoE